MSSNGKKVIVKKLAKVAKKTPTKKLAKVAKKTPTKKLKEEDEDIEYEDTTTEESSSDESSSEESSSEESSSDESSDESSDDEEFILKIPNDNYYDNTIVCYEEIDVDKLNHIIKNKEHFKKLVKKMEDYKTSDIDESFELAERILNKSRQGRIKVHYRQRHKVGRYYAIRKLGMQLLLRPLRQTIQKGYVDVDVCNCGPSLLKYICQINKIKCPVLTEYCKDRDNFIKEDGMTKAQGKTLCNQILNCEEEFKLNNKRKNFKRFNCEVNEIQDELICKYESEYSKFKKKIENDDKENNTKTKNIKGKFMSRVIFHTESIMLLKMYEFFEKPKSEKKKLDKKQSDEPSSAVLCFDGLMLKKSDDIKYDAKLKECEEYIFKKMGGLKIKLAIKPFDDKFDDSEFKDMEKFEEVRLQFYSDHLNLIGKDVELEHMQELINNMLIYAINGGKGVFFTKNIEIDIKTKRKTISYKCVNEEELLSNLDRVCNIINPEYDSNFKSIDGIFDMRAKRYLYTNIGKSVGKGVSFLSDCIKNMSNGNKNKELKTTINAYEKVEFYPYLKRRGVPDMHGKFNLFAGFPLEDEEIEEEINFEESHFYNHLKVCVCNEDEGEFKHLLDTWADKIQLPATVRANAHLFFGLPGTGKSLIGYFLTNLFGIDNSYTFINLDAAFGKFNVSTVNKIIKNFEEIGSKYGKNNKQLSEFADLLKGMITAEDESIEGKCKDAYKVYHFAMYIFFTNHESCLNIENTCRRYTMHRLRSEFAKNKQYFAPIWKELKNKNFMKSAFEYFANRKYNEDDIQECYETVYKQDQKIDSMASGIKYLKYLIENNYKTPIPNSTILRQVKLDEGWIRADILSQYYIDWVRVNSGTFAANKCSTAGFTTQLRNIGVLAKSHKFPLKDGTKGPKGGTKGPNERCFEIDEKTLIPKFKQYLENTSFEFDKLESDDKVDDKDDKVNDIELAEDSDDTIGGSDADDDEDDSFTKSNGVKITPKRSRSV